MKKIIQKPLFQFALLFLGIIIAHGFERPKSRQSTGMAIIINENTIDKLSDDFERQWNRKPSKEELVTQLVEFARQELLSQEHLEQSPDSSVNTFNKALSNPGGLPVSDHTPNMGGYGGRLIRRKP